MSWIKRLLDSNFHPWKTLAAKLLELAGGTKILHSNLSMSRECYIGFTITCDFKLWKEVKSEFRLPERMIFRWYSIILSIPRDWKTIMKKVDSEYYANTGDNDTYIVFKKQLMSVGTIRTKEFYDLLISKIFKQLFSQKTLARKLNVAIFNWKKIYTLPRKITHDSYSRIFQCKVLNNILYLNKHLHQSKIVSTPSTLCAVQLMKQFFICLENAF